MTLLSAWKYSRIGVFSTRNAKVICSPNPQKITRGWMARRWFENTYATAITTTRPNSPVKRSIGNPRSADDFENQFAALGRGGRDAERVLDQLRGLLDVIFASVVQAAQHAAGIHFLPDLHFEDDAHRRIDGILLGIAARAD